MKPPEKDKDLEEELEDGDSNNPARLTIFSMNESTKERMEADALRKKSAVYYFFDKEFILDKRALYIFSRSNPIRTWLVWLTKSKWFDYFIILCILLNAILLAIGERDEYYDRNAD